MRRFVIFLLLCVLPLQFALAGAVDAFDHANDGHSEHSHAAGADAKAVTVDSGSNDDSASRGHGDCGTCHFFHSLALFAPYADPIRLAPALDPPSRGSADHQNRVTALRPERPKWSQPA